VGKRLPHEVSKKKNKRRKKEYMTERESEGTLFT
jgi:hypothetical protein